MSGYKLQLSQRRYHQCRKCGVIIFFDTNVKAKSGKLVPLEKSTGLPHNCPGTREETF
jgi:hypothetical protein